MLGSWPAAAGPVEAAFGLLLDHLSREGERKLRLSLEGREARETHRKGRRATRRVGRCIKGERRGSEVAGRICLDHAAVRELPHASLLLLFVFVFMPDAFSLCSSL